MTRWMCSSLYLLTVLFLSASGRLAAAATYVIKPDGTGDFPTVQAAVNAAANGDIIQLTDGVFSGDGNRDVDYSGKALTIRSQSGLPDACIIDCDGTDVSPHRGFFFHTDEDHNSILEGLTITGGLITEDSGDWPLDTGGGILIVQSAPMITNVVLEGNVATKGGALSCVGDRSLPLITECDFLNNSVAAYGGFGGAVACRISSPTFSDCRFAGNSAFLGGAIGSSSFSSLSFTRCTFDNNMAIGSGSVWRSDADDSGTLASCTIVNNSASQGATLDLDGVFGIENTIIAFNSGELVIYCVGSNSVTLSCCDVYGNEGGDWTGCIEDQLGFDGNISADPLFCGADDGDFTLQVGSPCAPEHNPECGLIGAWPVGCGPPIVVEESTWGQIKTRYSR